MKIQVAGTGCATCHKLHQIVLQAAQELGLEQEVEYLTGTQGIAKIMELGSMSSPVLAIDNELVMTGFTNDMNKIKSLLSSNNTDKNCCKDGKCSENCNRAENCHCSTSCCSAKDQVSNACTCDGQTSTKSICQCRVGC